ncbi:MBL fold metallo-hydrolase [Desulfovibrio sp. JC022]|uniref:MBL fold metallo-hydrolase n=1 Tax=Desulfovibrio sp. JC022 TaxID=2593642 RepID=UPI0013D20686|nr:MBL fold metallo-hydrolase [Desulfovibrio sp. JC022]
MKIIIHRGTNEIGGSCVVVEHQGTRVLIDAGTPLDDSPASLPENVGDFDAVLISHSHQDHYGLLAQLPPEVPVYIGKVAWNFVQGVSFFKPDGSLLPHKPIFFEAGKPVQIGAIKVLPLMVDHSSPDAFGFLLEAGAKKIYYSGDFRAHGRKGKTFEYLCSHLPKDIDAILLEGTMLCRDNSKYSSENEVEQGVLDAAKAEDGLVCVNFSAQNIDRLVSVYRAAKRSGRIFVVDIYTAWIMRVAQKLSPKIPDMSWDDIRVLSKDRPAGFYYGVIKKNPDYFGRFTHELYKQGTVLTVEDIVTSPSRYLMRLNENYTGYILDRLEGKSATVIYSQWAGYLDNRCTHYNAKAAELRDREDCKFDLIHTSGHAVVEDLKRFVEAVQPQRIIPLHTEYKELYASTFSNVHVLEDGQVLEL